MSEILVAGGAGYIGTHVLVALIERGYGCVCVDNYSNSSPVAVERVAALTGARIAAYEADLRDVAGLRRICAAHDLAGVVHLAGLKSVAQSVADPALYHDNNVRGTACLLEAISQTRVSKFVFSSSATVYGIAAPIPYTEESPTGPANPYGENKLEIEGMLREFAARRPGLRVANLRYFNPVGAHPSGMIGEDPSGVPNNLMPFVCQVATGRREHLSLFGSDYPTRDGTGVRDYIHVMDLAEGHVAALEALDRGDLPQVLTVNLGTGRGHSVLELVHAFERASGRRIPIAAAARRAGDIAEYYADASRARRLLGWEARRSLDDMCRDAWNWQSRNPDGYRAAKADR